jgi:hypothetical protein
MKGIKAYLTIEIKDKHGQLISYEKKEANSYVQAFIDLLFVYLTDTSLAGVTDTGNTGRTIGYLTSQIQVNGLCVAASAVSDRGIVVGTGTGAVAVTNYALGTQIVHGSGAGQLYYNASQAQAPTTVGSTHSFTLIRSFTNSTASTITIQEVGIYAVFYGTDTNERKFCIDRTLTTKAVPASATATVTYTIGVTV